MEGVLVYIDDILIFAETVEQHDSILRQVLRRLHANPLGISRLSWNLTGVAM